MTARRYGRVNRSEGKVEMRYRFVAVIVGLTLPAVLAAGIAQPQGLEDPIELPVVEAKHAGLIDPMTMGTACLREPGEQTGICLDAFGPPRVHSFLPVAASGRLKIRTSVLPDSIVVRIAHVKTILPESTRKLALRRVGPRRFVARLPKHLGRNNRINVFITWDNPTDGTGDADFWTGMRRDCG